MQIYKVLIKNTDYSRGIDYTITSSTCNIFIKKELALKFAHDKANEFYKLYNEIFYASVVCTCILGKIRNLHPF